jgi:hypothetical protein
MDETDQMDDMDGFLSPPSNARIDDVAGYVQKQRTRIGRAISSMGVDDLRDQLIRRSIEIVMLRRICRNIDFLSEVRNESLIREIDKTSQQAKELDELSGRIEEFRRHRIKGAEEKKRKDQKQAAKASVHEFWREWNDGKHRKIKTVEQFAIEAMRRWPILKSPKVIGRWSATWSKEAKRGKESE